MVVTLECKYFFISILVHLTKSNLLVNKVGRAGTQTQKLSDVQESVALRWPKGIVDYYVDDSIYDDYIAQRIRVAINALETASCVKFQKMTTKPGWDMSWIHFTNPHGERKCVHEPVFRKNGEIVLVLGFDCMNQHEILHTLLHAIGFNDEVTHPQRDQYIRVMWNNIQPEYRKLYRIRHSDDKTSQVLVEYDPLSVMQFHDRAFSINGQATIMPLVPGLFISPSDDLSQLDKMRLRLLFDHECNKRKIGDMVETCRMLLNKNAKKDDEHEGSNVDTTHEHTDADEIIRIPMQDDEHKDNKRKLDTTDNKNDSSGHQLDKVETQTEKMIIVESSVQDDNDI